MGAPASVIVGILQKKKAAATAAASSVFLTFDFVHITAPHARLCCRRMCSTFAPSSSAVLPLDIVPGNRAVFVFYTDARGALSGHALATACGTLPGSGVAMYAEFDLGDVAERIVACASGHRASGMPSFPCDFECRPHNLRARVAAYVFACDHLQPPAGAEQVPLRILQIRYRRVGSSAYDFLQPEAGHSARFPHVECA